MLFILQWSVHIDNINPRPKLQMHPPPSKKTKTRMQWYKTTPFEEGIDIFNTVSAAIITILSVLWGYFEAGYSA